MTARIPANNDTTTLAGLATANGPWLMARLKRLADLADMRLAPELIQSAVNHSALSLRRILAEEGRPSNTANHLTDQAAQMGRHEAAAHMAAGLDLPGSLRLLRLLRRAYDDLLRESWVDKASRARAREDVEHFFERTLIGLYVAWAEAARATCEDTRASLSANAIDPAEHERVTAMLARREDELRRTLTAAQRATALLRKERERTAHLAELLAQCSTEQPGCCQPGEAGTQASTSPAPVIDPEYASGLEAELGQTRAALTQLRTEARTAIAQAKLAVRETHSRLGDQLRRQITESAHLTAELETLRSELSRTVDGMERASRAEAETAARYAALRAELTESQAENTDRLTRVQRDLEAAERTVSELRALLEARQADNDACQSVARFDCENLSARCQDLESSLAAQSAGAALLREQTESAQAESESLRAALCALRNERDSLATQLAETSENQARDQRARQDAEKRTSALQRRLTETESALARVEEELATSHNATHDQHCEDNLAQCEADLLRESQIMAATLSLTTEAVAVIDEAGRFTSWNARFPTLFNLSDEVMTGSLALALPEMARTLRTPEPFLVRLRELMADPTVRESGLTLLTNSGKTLVLRSLPVLTETPAETNTTTPHPACRIPAGHIIGLRDVSLEHDLEDLVREIEAITRYDQGPSLRAFLHLPQELLCELPGLTSAQADKLATVRDAAYRLFDTINMAMDVFQMERGLYHPAHNKQMDLATALRHATRELLTLAMDHKICVEMQFNGRPLTQDDDLPGLGDPQLLHTLTATLLREAVRQSPPGSTVLAALSRDDIDQCLRMDISHRVSLSPAERKSYFDKPTPGKDRDGSGKARYAAWLIARALGGSLDLAAPVIQETTKLQPQSITITLRLPWDGVAHESAED